MEHTLNWHCLIQDADDGDYCHERRTSVGPICLRLAENDHCSKLTFVSFCAAVDCNVQANLQANIAAGLCLGLGQSFYIPLWTGQNTALYSKLGRMQISKYLALRGNL